tara:strand:- start:901 stop:1644 length:744 start_codon:yes stop_codon:yes gene_type:complete
MKKSVFILGITTLVLTSCSELKPLAQEIGRGILESPAAESSIPSTLEMGSGLKEALIKGTQTGVTNLSKSGGYSDQPMVRIPFPEEYSNVADKLRSIGLGNQIEEVELSLNRAAEDAVVEATPLFVNAITSMTIQDAQGILFGGENAATNYLKSKTSEQLAVSFTPKIEASLAKVNATKYWNTATNAYNMIPFVTKVDGNLTNYATNKAIEGLFLKIAEEEKEIRQNPKERTSDLLKKVFDYAAAKN